MASEITRPGRLADKVVFITGTASGQGRAAAQLFAAEGGRIVGCDVNAEGAEETVELVRKAGGEMISSSPVDLSAADAAREWIEWGVAETGGIDVLYNNASLPKMAPIGHIDPADWSFTLRNELDLIAWATQAAWPHLIERGGGSIINTASCAGHIGWSGMPAAAHAATKGGVISLTRQTAAEGHHHRIRANSISPGTIVTPVIRAGVASGQLTMRQSMPLGRLGRPVDIAYFALYLASDESEWVTASDFVIDGGQTKILGVEETVLTLEILDR